MFDARDTCPHLGDVDRPLGIVGAVDVQRVDANAGDVGGDQPR